MPNAGRIFNVLNNAKDLDKTVLESETQNDIINAVIAWLDTWLRATYIDDEPISNAGILVWKSCGASMEQSVLRWLKEDDALSRIEIAACFLWGYWRDATEIEAEIVITFLAMLDELPQDSMAYVSVLFALFSVARNNEAKLPKSLIQRIRKLLIQRVESLEKSGKQESAVDFLKERFRYLSWR